MIQWYSRGRCKGAKGLQCEYVTWVHHNAHSSWAEDSQKWSTTCQVIQDVATGRQIQDKDGWLSRVHWWAWYEGRKGLVMPVT